MPALFSLQRARGAINSLITVFNGTEAAVMARLLVLREAGARGEAPFWTASELRERLAFLDEAKLEHIIGRLRVNGLLAWDSETARYSVSPLGRMTIAALSVLLLKLCPAPALIACDPDPAGIQIAMAVGALWLLAQRPWRPWGMGVEALKSLSKHRPLNEEDDSILNRLDERNLPAELRLAADWMREQGMKGEQEGLTLQTLEREYRALNLV